MALETKHKKALAIGSLVGALLGAGATWLMIKAPTDLIEGEEPEPISAGEIVNLTGAAATLINLVDNFRRRL
jgi:hypothetical protein